MATTTSTINITLAEDIFSVAIEVCSSSRPHPGELDAPRLLEDFIFESTEHDGYPSVLFVILQALFQVPDDVDAQGRVFAPSRDLILYTVTEIFRQRSDVPEFLRAAVRNTAEDIVQSLFVPVFQGIVSNNGVRRSGNLYNRIFMRDDAECLITGLQEPNTDLHIFQIIPYPRGFLDMRSASHRLFWRWLEPFAPGTRSAVGLAIPREGNCLLVSKEILVLFQTLQIWLEPAEGENSYQLCTSKNDSALPMRCCKGQIVTFRNNAGYRQIELPNPKLLAVHAALARVADASGVFEYASAY